MLMQKKLKILVVVYVLLVVALAVRVPVIRQDIFDQIALPPLPESSTLNEPAPVNTWAYVWELGHRPDGSRLDLRWAFYLREQAVLLFALMFTVPKIDKRASVTGWVVRYAWLLPLILYIGFAVWRVLWVPCIWTYHYGVHTNQAHTYAYTLPLWRIDSQDIRYGLIFFEELVLLALVVGCYALMFAASPGLRKRIKSFGGQDKVPAR
jgi:hypothetical protein